MVHTYSGVLFSLKRKKILPCAAQMNFEDNMLSKISQTQKGKYCMIYLQAALGGVKIIQTESGIVDARLGDGGGWW